MGKRDADDGDATYADVEALPPHIVGEIIRGKLYTHARPALPHADATSVLAAELYGPFRRGLGGPGGWFIVHEPELHLEKGPSNETKLRPVVPDLAGWRMERKPPRIRKPHYITIPPDWICETLSDSTEKIDRDEKMPLYAEAGIPYLWFIDEAHKTLEVYVLQGDGSWCSSGIYKDAARVRAVPFEDFELDLHLLWGDE
jgi:Uma2 family endonuclease